MTITLMHTTKGLAVVQTPLRLSLNLGPVSYKQAALQGAAGNIPADTLTASGQDKNVAYGWDGLESDMPLTCGGSQPWKDSASWGSLAARGAALQSAACIA
jgi:hypothetical protein